MTTTRNPAADKHPGREEVLSILRDFKLECADEFGILEIGVFGSVARDTADSDSDLDICVKTKAPNPYILVHIKDAIEGRIQRKVDIVRLRERMNPLLKERIEREGIYV